MAMKTTYVSCYAGNCYTCSYSPDMYMGCGYTPGHNPLDVSPK